MIETDAAVMRGQGFRDNPNARQEERFNYLVFYLIFN